MNFKYQIEYAKVDLFVLVMSLMKNRMIMKVVFHDYLFNVMAANSGIYYGH